MITLGLGKIFPKRRGPSHSGLQTLSEIVELLEPSPLVLQALSETVAWCLRRPLQQDQFRSRELDPSALLRVPPFGESNIGVWLEKSGRATSQLLTRSTQIAPPSFAIGT